MIFCFFVRYPDDLDVFDANVSGGRVLGVHSAQLSVFAIAVVVPGAIVVQVVRRKRKQK